MHRLVPEITGSVCKLFQKALIQSQQQLQLVQQPFVVSPPAVPKQIEKKPAPPPQPAPVDITDKQVYLATPDGKMTAYKVVLHTGNDVMPNITPRTENR